VNTCFVSVEALSSNPIHTKKKKKKKRERERKSRKEIESGECLFNWLR
jgi:hypothetical protein